jgi:hypothetical protein
MAFRTNRAYAPAWPLFRTATRAQYGPVTAEPVFAVTANGQVGMMRQRGKPIENPALFRIFHFHAIFSGKGGPRFLNSAARPIFTRSANRAYTENAY